MSLKCRMLSPEKNAYLNSFDGRVEVVYLYTQDLGLITQDSAL